MLVDDAGGEGVSALAARTQSLSYPAGQRGTQVFAKKQRGLDGSRTAS